MPVSSGSGPNEPPGGSGGPQDTPVVERRAVRVVVLDAGGLVLLLRTRDLGNPAFETSWELPGGGIQPRETFADAVIRELREETGIVITPDRVAEPTWRRRASYVYRGVRRVQSETVTVVHLDRSEPEVGDAYRVDFERTDHFGHRWWTVAGIAASSERFYPRRLPALLPGFLAGESIDEPFEYWP
jgi:8-oxo-dGTP pyrophosphatase MutT (NUDIX family)